MPGNDPVVTRAYILSCADKLLFLNVDVVERDNAGQGGLLVQESQDVEPKPGRVYAKPYGSIRIALELTKAQRFNSLVNPLLEQSFMKFSC